MDVVAVPAMRQMPGDCLLVTGQMLPRHIGTLATFNFALDLLRVTPLRSTSLLSFFDA